MFHIDQNRFGPTDCQALIVSMRFAFHFSIDSQKIFKIQSVHIALDIFNNFIQLLIGENDHGVAILDSRVVRDVVLILDGFEKYQLKADEE